MSKIILFFTLASIVFLPCQGFSKETKRGQVTNLPIPRYVSLKAKEANARRGPSLSHKIDWIYKRENIPLEIESNEHNIKYLEVKKSKLGHHLKLNKK